MRILQLASKPPVPAVDGGALAINSVTDCLISAGHEVKLLCIETKKHPLLREKLTDDYKSATRIESVFINTEVRILAAFLNLFSSSCYNVTRFYSQAFATKLSRVLQDTSFDIIQLESLYMMPYFDCIRQFSNAKIVLRAHNVESHLWNRRTAQENNPLKRRWFSHLTKNLFRYEAEAFTRVDGILPITTADRQTIAEMTKGRIKSIEVLPFAINLPTNDVRRVPKPFTVFHIGAMDWQPNIEGVAWLVREVWPKVLATLSRAELHLAGRDFPDNDPRFQGKNIFVHGEVTSALEFMSEYSVMAVPLLTGGGMRVKLVEGMALAKAIVATSVGAEGTNTENDEQLLVKDSAADFAEAICRLLNDENHAHQLGSRAKDFATTNFGCAFASKKLTHFYSSLLK